MVDRFETIAGCLIGMAVGDSLGLPFEGLAPRRVNRLLGDGPLRHRFLFGRGMLSDDTDHACLAAQAFLHSDGDLSAFEKRLGKEIKSWFLTLPAGIGLATLKASLRLLGGVPPHRSGVRSAGNGPAMRAPILGLLCESGPEGSRWIDASTAITHRHPLANAGARMIATAARAAANGEPAETFLEKAKGTDEPELQRVIGALEAGGTPWAAERGVSGYIVHTVGAALDCWLRHRGDFRGAVEAAIRLGGDTDTVAAIVGGLVGAEVGLDGIPAEWRAGLLDFPRSEGWILGLSQRLASGDKGAAPIFWPAYLVRTPLFTATVLAHGFRRLLPPY